MLKQIRKVFSAMLIATFFVSTFIFSNQTVKACPPSIPATLLSLYANSDLIILARFENEIITKKNNENEHGYFANLERNLEINKIYKGNANLKKVIYEAYEYKPNVTETANTDQIKSFRTFGYGTTVPVKVGEEYLFFLQESEDGKYYVTDNLGGVKNADESLRIYEENLRELDTIAKNPKNQLDNVTKWLVKSLDEPVLRWGAIQDLSNSSNSLAYEKRDPKDSEKNVQPFLLDKTFGTYSSVIAKNLNNSQKERIENILTEEIQQSWFGVEPKRIDYRLVQIVKNWNKTGLATDAFGVLQGLDESKFATKLIVMEFIANIAEDGKLYDVQYAYAGIKLGKTPEIQAKNLTARNVQMQKFNNRFQTLLMQNFEPKTKDGELTEF